MARFETDFGWKYRPRVSMVFTPGHSLNECAETRAFLTNRNLIAVDQDPLGIQGHRVKRLR